MTKFLINISRLFKVIYIITYYKIHIADKHYFPKYIKFTLNLFTLLFHPIKFFITPNDSLGSRIRQCLTELGSIYIKFGQTLSTRPDLIGIEITDELKQLQDKLPAFNFNIVKETIEKKLAKNLSDMFSKFDETPVASASIAQVHHATLKNGLQVAVKILRPNIHQKYACDIELLAFCSNIAMIFLNKNINRLKLNEIIAVFRCTMENELNLQMEAASASALHDNFIKDDNIYIPKIYWNYSCNHVLTLEWAHGISIYDTEQINKLGLNKRDIASKIATAFFNQAFRDGFFHADLHPGNILVKSDGSITLIDFGIMGQLSEQDRFAIAEILYAFLNRDYNLVAKIHHRIKYIPENTDLNKFALRCRIIADPIIGLQAKNISIGKLLSELFKVTEEFGMETQPQLLLLQKTMVVVEGIGKTLDKEINMWQLAEPWIKKWYAQNLSPEAKFLRVVKSYVKRIVN